MTPEKERELIDAMVSEYWRLPMDNEHHKRMCAALRIAAPILRNEVARDAFSAGFWAWNGPSNEAELDRDIAMEQEAWEEYASAIRSLKTKDKPE